MSVGSRMDVKDVKKHIGILCYISLKNGNTYTAIIPDFEGDSFTIIDKIGEEVSIDCDYIGCIDPVEKKINKEKKGWEDG